MTQVSTFERRFNVSLRCYTLENATDKHQYKAIFHGFRNGVFQQIVYFSHLCYKQNLIVYLMSIQHMFSANIRR